jgi:hypothetical protein
VLLSGLYAPEGIRLQKRSVKPEEDARSGLVVWRLVAGAGNGMGAVYVPEASEERIFVSRHFLPSVETSVVLSPIYDCRSVQLPQNPEKLSRCPSSRTDVVHNWRRSYLHQAPGGGGGPRLAMRDSL